MGRRHLMTATLGAALLCAGCGDDGAPGDAGPDAGAPRDGGGADGGGPRDAGPVERPPTGLLPDRPDALPLSFDRPDRGDPVSAAELAALTDRYLELLERTRYFALVDERAHGWPESDPEGRYWYATWWSGAGIEKRGSAMTYRHVRAGADNNGLRTGPILEGACFAHALWGEASVEHLVHRLVRGVVSWFLAMERVPMDPERFLLSRAAYPRSVMDTERGVLIDYEPSRPGDDNPATQYVHLPLNPTWGDLWVKNKRSKDDIGHLMRALAQLESCWDGLGGTERGDVVDMRRRFMGWSRRVEDDGWAIATFDQDLELWHPNESLARFFDVSDVECPAILGIRLLGRGDPGGRDCGDGVGPVGEVDGLNSKNLQILRSFHEAAVLMAILFDEPELARAMLAGLASRLDTLMDRYDAGDPPENTTPAHLAELIFHAGNLGVPLTSREVRFAHRQIDVAHGSYLDASRAVHYRLREAPDGDYPLTPPGDGIEFRDLGLPLGSCAARYRNPGSRPLLDCDRLRAARP